LEILARLRKTVVGEDLNFGLMLGSYIMTMQLLMTPSSGSSGPKIDNEIGPCTIFARFDPVRLLAIPKLKTALKGHRFSNIADIQGHATTILQSIPEEEFQKCFEQWKNRLSKCIGAQGDYFEGDSNH
jgi:hypothetical protein